MSTLVNTQKEIKNLKTFSTAAERFEGSHLLCPGCAHSIIVREVLNATNDNLVVSASTGCLERGHDFMYVCLDNEVYANTGGQRSSSTPIGASTTTAPAGSHSYGEKRQKKDIVSIMAAHGAPYVAQVAPNKWKDMVKKIQTGFDTHGPVFINAMSACTTEWKFAPNQTIEVSDLAVDSLVFPLYEIIGGRELNITYRPKNIVPVRDYLGAQPRFKHLFKPENEYLIDEWQKRIDERWVFLQKREEIRM